MYDTMYLVQYTVEVQVQTVGLCRVPGTVHCSSTCASYGALLPTQVLCIPYRYVLCGILLKYNFKL